MTARQDLLQAARSLAATGQIEFSPAELIAEARRQGSRYPDSTLRTHILGPMCANTAEHHGVKWGDLVRVGRGRYRLAQHADDPVPPPPAVLSRPGRRVDVPADDPPAHDPHEEWYWEGNVQAAVVTHLARQGWQIRRVADTASQQHGHDIEAVRDGQRLLVEVKGYPSDRYMRGPRRGLPKPTAPALQARHTFAGAVLTALLARGDDPNATTVIAVPDFDTYRTLARRTRDPVTAAGIDIWLVRQDGHVIEIG